MQILDYLSKAPFWDSLSTKEKQLAIDNSTIKKYSKNEVIHSHDRSCLGMIYVISGSIRVCVISEEGREVTLYRLRKGVACVVSASCVLKDISLETEIIAAEDLEMLVLNATTFKRLMDDNVYVRCYAYELATKRFSEALWVLQDIIFAGFDKRLANFLLGYYEQTGKKELKMTQETIAQDVNSAREVVARMLRLFAEDGLVEMKRGCIILKDTEGLKQFI